MTQALISKTINFTKDNCLLLALLLFGFLMSLFFLSASVSAVSGSDSNGAISSALCEVTDDPNTPNSSAQRQVCRDRIEAELDRCEVTDDPSTPNSSAGRLNCREGVIDRHSPSSGGSGRTVPSDRGADCSESLHPDDCAIMAYIRIITDALIVLVGVTVVMMIVIGGIQYSAAGSNPQAVQAAKKKISQALLALVIYIFMSAFLQWLVPGGVFN